MSVLYLLPGLLCDEVTWAHQVAGLADLAQVRVPVFYGFHSLTAMAESVLADAPGRFAVAGHSMGARVALEIARLAPKRVERIALLDTGTHPVQPGEPEKRQVLVDLAEAEGMGALADRWLPPMLHPDAARSAALMPVLHAMVCRATPAIYRGQITALLNRPDADAVVRTLRCPTLVACGRQDAWSPLGQHEAIVTLASHARLVVFEDSGHMAPMEAADAVTGALREWMADADR